MSPKVLCCLIIIRKFYLQKGEMRWKHKIAHLRIHSAHSIYCLAMPYSTMSIFKAVLRLIRTTKKKYKYEELKTKMKTEHAQTLIWASELASHFFSIYFFPCVSFQNFLSLLMRQVKNTARIYFLNLINCSRV